MCDYSLHNTASRPAKVGDKLVTTGFYGTLTHGFAAVGEPYVAVCVLPGTELAFDREIKLDGFWGYGRTGHRTAIFRQIDQDQPGVFHDALEFADGRRVLLTQLGDGQHATVLQLPAITRASDEVVQPDGRALVD